MFVHHDRPKEPVWEGFTNIQFDMKNYRIDVRTFGRLSRYMRREAAPLERPPLISLVNCRDLLLGRLRLRRFALQCLAGNVGGRRSERRGAKPAALDGSLPLPVDGRVCTASPPVDVPGLTGVPGSSGFFGRQSAEQLPFLQQQVPFGQSLSLPQAQSEAFLATAAVRAIVVAAALETDQTLLFGLAADEAVAAVELRAARVQQCRRPSGCRHHGVLLRSVDRSPQNRTHNRHS